MLAFGFFLIGYYAGVLPLEIIGLESGTAISLDTLTLPVILVTAVIDSINPCAIGVLLLLIATLVSISRAEKLQIKKTIEDG